MDIEKRILELLYFKDCVIIPGLGGFVSNYVPARIREESQSFIPPAKEIGFNRELVQDDGVLSGYLARCGKTSISDAKNRIEEFVILILDKLAGQERYILTSIGEFSYARTGELLFKSYNEINLLSESYGLKSFYFTKFEREKEHPLLKSAIFKHGDKTRTVTLPGTQSKAEKQKSFRRVAVAIPLLIAISLLPLNSRHGLEKEQNSGFFTLPSLSVIEMTENNSSSETKDINTYSDLSSDSKGGEIINEPFDRNSFAIIAGSFSSKKNAQVLSDDLSKKGYGPEIWKASNGFYRVVVQAYESMAGAQEAVAVLNDELDGIEFWILD